MTTTASQKATRKLTHFQGEPFTLDGLSKHPAPQQNGGEAVELSDISLSFYLSYDFLFIMT